MAELPEHFYTYVTSTATIAGVPVPIAAFDIIYALDQVPKASLSVALGQGMSGPDKGKISAGHDLLSQIRPFSPVEIKINLKASPKGRFCKSSEDSGLIDGTDQTIFKGFHFTPSQTKDRMGNSASMTFQAIGYPGALGGSTQVTTAQVSMKLESGADVIAVRLGDAGSGPSAYHNLATLLQDDNDKRWVDYMILYVIFERLIRMTSTFTREGVNSSARVALDRMRGTPRPLGAPQMRLVFGNVPEDLYNKALSRFYGNVLRMDWLNSQQDLWSILVNLAKVLMFRVVPAIEHDALVPVTYGLDGEPWRSFLPSDYWRTSLTPDSFSKEFYSYIGKVGLLLPNTYHGLYQDKLPLGVSMGFAQLPNLNAGGPLNAEVASRIVTIPTPDFLICPGPTSRLSGLGGGPVPTAADPDTAIPDIHHGEDMKAYYGGALGNGYAASYLHDNVFDHRRCTLTGRFRLDIAPGSLVKIVTIGDRFVGKQETFFGHALSVRLFASPEGGGLGTEFLIGSLRTEEEHKQYTVPKHPLYNLRWVGAKLTD